MLSLPESRAGRGQEQVRKPPPLKGRGREKEERLTKNGTEYRFGFACRALVKIANNGYLSDGEEMVFLQ